MYILLIPFDNFRLIPISLSNLIIVALLGVFVLNAAKNKMTISRGALPYYSPLFVGVFLLVAISIFSLPFFPEALAVKFKDIFFLSTTTLFLLIFSARANNDLRFFDHFLHALLFSALISTSLGYYEYIHFFLHGDYWQPPILMRFDGIVLYPWMIRMRGTYFDPNYFSLITSVGLGLSLSLKLNNKIRFILVLFFVVATVLTFSRMAALGLMATAAIYIYFKRERKLARQLILLTLTIAIILGSPFLLIKMSEVNPESTENRLSHLEDGIDKIMQSPVFGYGLGTRLQDDYEEGKEAHNTFVQVALYGGIPVLFFVFIPLFLHLYRTLIAPISINTDLGRIKFFILLFAPSFFFGLTFLSYFNIKYFWVFYAVIIQFTHLNSLEESLKESHVG